MPLQHPEACGLGEKDMRVNSMPQAYTLAGSTAGPATSPAVSCGVPESPAFDPSFAAEVGALVGSLQSPPRLRVCIVGALFRACNWASNTLQELRQSLRKVLWML